MHFTYLYISLPLLHDYDVKMPNFTSQGGRKQATTKFYSLPKLEYGSKKFSSGRVHLLLTKYVSWNNRDKDQKNANSFLKRRFRCPARRRIVKSLLQRSDAKILSSLRTATKEERLQVNEDISLSRFTHTSIRYFRNEKGTGAEMRPAIVCGIVTGDAPVSY